MGISYKEYKLTDREYETARQFEEEHNKKHGDERPPFGGRYGILFVPNSMSKSVEVKCGACNEVKDVTDYDSW